VNRSRILGGRQRRLRDLGKSGGPEREKDGKNYVINSRVGGEGLTGKSNVWGRRENGQNNQKRGLGEKKE